MYTGYITAPLEFRIVFLWSKQHLQIESSFVGPTPSHTTHGIYCRQPGPVYNPVLCCTPVEMDETSALFNKRALTLFTSIRMLCMADHSWASEAASVVALLLVQKSADERARFDPLCHNSQVLKRHDNPRLVRIAGQEQL